MALRGFFEQIRQTGAGVWWLSRYAIGVEPVETSLSSFTARSPVIERGSPTTYEVVCVHEGKRPLWATLAFHIHAEQTDSSSVPYASFSKDIVLLPREPLSVEIFYDWSEAVVLGLAGIQVEPDEFQRGAVARTGYHRITATLSTRRGAIIERLTLRQRLAA